MHHQFLSMSRQLRSRSLIFFTKATLKLYNEKISFYAAISNEPISVATDTIQSITENILSKEYFNVSILIVKLNAIKISNMAQGRKLSLIDKVQAVIEEISKIVSAPTIGQRFSLLLLRQRRIHLSLSQLSNQPMESRGYS